MSERRVFGDVVAFSLGLRDAKTLATRTLRASGVAATRISCGPKQIRITPQIPAEDTFIVAQYLTRLPYHELWSGGRPLLQQGYDTNAMRIVNLTGEFSARITHPHELLTFHIPRIALDELADEAGRPRLGNLACTPGIVDPVLVHLAEALLPAFKRPEQVNSLFVDYIILAVCSYLADKYSDGAPPPAVKKGGLTTAQFRRAKEILIANSSGHILLADVARECGLSRQYFTKAFKATTGFAPHRWLQQHRIDDAKRLLSETALPIADIAIRCGFADQSHLTRVFTTLAGVSPAAWRRLRDWAPIRS